MDEDYKGSSCTEEQYMQVCMAVSRIIAKFPHHFFRTSIAGRGYIVEVLDASPEQVCAMNMKLVDEVCSVDILDDCNLTARFSVKRPTVNRIKYSYKNK